MSFPITDAIFGKGVYYDGSKPNIMIPGRVALITDIAITLICLTFAILSVTKVLALPSIVTYSLFGGAGLFVLANALNAAFIPARYRRAMED